MITTTGTGWVEPSASDSFEYLTGGDSAIASMQYSYKPSWLSYLVDPDIAGAASRALFDAVYARWAQLPVDARPRLYVFGESLGSFGTETAFSGVGDLANRVDGALFVGPPSFNTLYPELTDRRDAGSPQVEPVYQDGEVVRFSRRPAASIPPRTRRGPAHVCSTCSTRRTRSPGGLPRCCSAVRTGWRRSGARRSSTPCAGCRW